jgi:peroxiredoxin (alkyl hydroperoxide reductase subunit C)
MSEVVRLNEPAPDFIDAVSTKGPISLSTYKGKWLVLFSYVADFTKVCESEINAFAMRAKDFEQRSTQLLAISADSIHAHLAWIGSMPGDGPTITFPIIADGGLIAKAYGMIHPGTPARFPVGTQGRDLGAALSGVTLSSVTSSAVGRCLFVIDPKQIVRAMLHYPVSLGRNVDEVIRIVDALQLNAERNLYTLANWKAGEKGVAPPRVVVE